MSEPTIAKPAMAAESGHWYLKDGTPFYEVPYADASKGMRKTTIKDARKVNALPSVTTILKVLHKEALVKWLIEQAVLVAVTSPRLEGESLDAFIERVLHTEKQQDVEAQKARDLGTNIHAAIEQAVSGQPWDESLKAYVSPVLTALEQFGTMRATEKVVVGDGYAGKTDYIAELEHAITVIDFKTGKTLPKDKAWDEHELQLSAYAKALGNTADKQVKTVNIYISTTEPGAIKVIEHGDWPTTYQLGFKPLLTHWQWRNDYTPKQ